MYLSGGDVDNPEAVRVGGAEGCGSSVLFSQFCFESKSALKHSLLKKVSK